MEEQKSLKQYCREAKKRLKNGFWKDYNAELDEKIKRAEESGVATSKVKEYYSGRVAEKIRNNKSDDERFYARVKDILESEGEVSDAIGRLTDKAYYETLSYEEKQRYTMSLSEKYLSALERYKKEKALLIHA